MLYMDFTMVIMVMSMMMYNMVMMNIRLNRRLIWMYLQYMLFRVKSLYMDKSTMKCNIAMRYIYRAATTLSSTRTGPRRGHSQRRQIASTA